MRIYIYIYIHMYVCMYVCMYKGVYVVLVDGLGLGVRV